MTSINRFTVRVYGILEWDEKILLSEEWIESFQFTKFPGGGLEFGEGTRECVEREFMEETGATVKAGKHLYTTDFFQQSAFRNTDQIISIYYQIESISDPSLISLDKFGLIQHARQEYMRFFWVPKNELIEEMLTFPIDKKVVGILKALS